ncbi:hypothetical protein [Thermococcus sp. Bubb.Bath]|uniref:hypothetical protein n=1 Tax=Thermococcus sp. Bubb.Bath TaxID=1638242 RepID=UPI0014394B62|nr:hypothetical protein [Thermococcus sp. Bubb.Bath]NJF24727.1 hypothetical protein [Thermococcus sp. Bubb.Bath]
MERWKRNVLGLLLISALVYGAYLLWLYEASGGTMTVSMEMPEWTFPILVGVFISAVAFGGGLFGTAIENPDFLRDGWGTAQLLVLSALLAALSTVWAFQMTGYLSTIQTVITTIFIIVAAVLVVRMKKEKLTPKTVITDERGEEIDLRSRALAGDTLVGIIAILLLGTSFKGFPRISTHAMTLYPLAAYGIVWFGAKLYYRRVM